MNHQQLLDLAEEFGTPLFVYDADVMEAQYKRLLNAFKGVKLNVQYACKALSNQAVLQHFNALGAGLDTVSIEEVQLGLRAGFTPERIIYTPNGVSFEEIKQAVELGVRVNIDNLVMLEKFGSEYGDKYPVCVRLNPHIVAGGNHKIQVGHIDSKFGISIHQMRHLTRIIKAYGIHVNGLHMHTGSDILDVGVFLKGTEILLEAAFQFAELEYIDFGSGFKVAYKPNDVATDIEELGEKLSVQFQEFCKEYGKELELAFEPGKFLVSESGTFLCKVNVIKQTTATVFAGVDTGFNHFIRPMFYDSYHHITNISNPEGPDRIYTVVGYICETDTFAWDRKIPEIRENDILAFHNAGAYVFAMSSNYNSRLKPAEVLLKGGKPYLISRRQTLDDLLVSQVDVSHLFKTKQKAVKDS
ncbi:MAG: diaminopimelate decarboxylase [Flavobacteriales bacterium]|nr:diaminopimelate decarboxylase [Flavobacteriales bacterium]